MGLLDKQKAYIAKEQEYKEASTRYNNEYKEFLATQERLARFTKGEDMYENVAEYNKDRDFYLKNKEEVQNAYNTIVALQEETQKLFNEVNGNELHSQ